MPTTDNVNAVKVRENTANNPYTLFPTLVELARGPEWRVRMAVADNPITPLALLESLAHDENYQVRSAVAEHPNTSESVLTLLAYDEDVEDVEVRRRVAEQDETPPAILERLAKDSHRFVRDATAFNAQTPPNAIAFFKAINSPALTVGLSFSTALTQ